MCMRVKLHELCPIPCDSMDCSPPGSSVHGNSAGKNTGVSCLALPLGDLPNPVIKPKCCVSCFAGRFFTHWATCEALQFNSVQFSSVTQWCPTLSDTMNCSTSGLPVHHQLPQFTQTHVHRVGDAIQPSHPLMSPSPPALNLSQHQGLFQWVNSLHAVAKVLEFQL